MSKEVEIVIDNLAQLYANQLDHDVAWAYAKRINKPTKYKGKGRPRNTDYVILEHPFDKSLMNILHK